MGQILSWIRGPREGGGVQDVAVEHQSQPKPPTSTPVAPVSTVKPAEFESSPIVSSKGETAKTEPSKPAAGDKAAKAAGKPGTPQEVKPKEMPKGAPVSPIKGKPVKVEPAAGAGGARTAAKPGKPEEVGPKETPKSKPSESSKLDPAKPAAAAAVDGATKAAAEASKGKAKQVKPKEGTKIQVEVERTSVTKSAEEPVLDPFAALAGSLPSEALVPTAPVYTGPEVTEHHITMEDEPVCGEDDDTLPPGYRFENMDKNIPVPEAKPTKPLSTDEALESLSFGFVSSSPPCLQQKQPKAEIAASASSAGPLKSAAPPADKKPKLEKGAEGFSLAGAVESPKPPADKKPKSDESMSLDALSALEDLLPTAEPTPEPLKVRPEDMVKVDKLKSKDAVRVGEREDTLPPDYRFKEEDLKDLPPPKVEPSLDPGEALDFLSGGFDTPAVAPIVQAPVPPSSKAPKKPSRDAVEALDLLSGDLPVCEAAPVSRMAPPPKVSLKKPADSGFSLEDIVAPTAAPSVQTERQLSSGAADALEALSDTLMDITPVPEPAPVPTRDVVKEKKVVKEKIIKMGERDDTLPPEFRLTEEEIKEMEKAEDVRPKEKPMGDAAALDLLSGDFSTPAAPAAPAAVAAPKTKSTAPPAEMPSQKGPVLDALASTLLPDAPEFRAKHSPVTDKPKESPAGDKPKAKSGKPKSRSKKQAVADTSAIDDLSEQLTSDVVPTSPAKKSSKS